MGTEPEWQRKVREANHASFERMRRQAAMTPICPNCGLAYEHAQRDQPCRGCRYRVNGYGQCQAVRVDGKRCQRPSMSGRDRRVCSEHVHAPQKTNDEWIDTIYPGWEDQP